MADVPTTANIQRLILETARLGSLPAGTMASGMYDRFTNVVGIDTSSVYTYGSYGAYTYCSPVTAFTGHTQYIIPTGNGDSQGPASDYTLVDDPPASPNDADYMYSSSPSTGDYGCFTFASPALLSFNVITNLIITVRAKYGTAGPKVCPMLKVNGTQYNQVAGTSVTGSFANYSTTFTTNPDTGAAWTLADINGTGTNPLEQIGYYSSTNNSGSGLYISQVFATITFSSTNHDMSLISMPITAEDLTHGASGTAMVSGIDSSTRLYISSSSTPSWTELTNLTLTGSNVLGAGIHQYITDYVPFTGSADCSMRWKITTDYGHATYVYGVALNWS